MKIAFDSTAFCIQRYGGVSRYFARLAQHLTLRNFDIRVFAPLHQNEYLTELPANIVDGKKIKKYPPKTTKIFKSLNGFFSKIKITRWQPQIIHETYYSARRSGSSRCPVVVTVFDMIHELYPNQFHSNDKTTELKRAAVERADSVICISENTRSDLINIFGTREEKISVVHLGVDRLIADGNEFDIKQVNGFRPYLLYVGGRKGYKNFLRFVSAVAASRRLKKEFNIVVFGGVPFSMVELRLFQDLGFNDRQIIHLHGSDSLLLQLYEQAAAFVYSSIYEGFGLPPLEAMAHGCPVVSSNRGSMPEVIGGAAEFFDPESIKDMAGAIERVVYSGDRAKLLIKRGRARISYFSWDRCVENTIAIYKAFY